MLRLLEAIEKDVVPLTTCVYIAEMSYYFG